MAEVVIIHCIIFFFRKIKVTNKCVALKLFHNIITVTLQSFFVTENSLQMLLLIV